MNVHDFEALPLPEFRTGVRRTANFWLFHHLPKTGGTSMTRELEALLSPYYNIHLRPGSVVESPVDFCVEDTRRFLGLHDQSPFRSASGHLRPPEIRSIREKIPETKLFTFLRNPVEQVVSQYRYLCTPSSPGHEAYLARYPTIDDWVNDPATANIIAGFIAPRDLVEAGDAAAIIDLMKASYVFVGLVEDYELSFLFLTALMFAPVGMLAGRLNRTVETGSNDVILSDALRARIAEVNHLDMKIYEAFSSVFRARRPRIERFVSDLRRG